MKKIYRSLSNRKLFLCLTAISIAFLVGGVVSEQLPAQQEPASGDIHIQIGAGEPVVPSEFNGDLRDLPQVITPEERKLFHPPLELDEEPPQHKKPLPWAQPEIPTPLPPGPLAPMPTPGAHIRRHELHFEWSRPSAGHRRGRGAKPFRSSRQYLDGHL